MADKKDQADASPEAEPLTEAQRLEKLEKNVGTNKTVLLVVALLLIIIISVSVTSFAIFTSQGDSKETTALKKQISELQQQVQTLSTKLEENASAIATVKGSVPKLEKKLSNSSNGVIIQLMVEQEGNHQEVLNAARSSIYDLAHMVPGSRTWLSTYSDEIDAAIEHSKKRQLALKKLQMGAPMPSVTEEDDGFGDF